jgi:hypothetical protein
MYLVEGLASYSLVLALTSNDDPLALTVPREVVDPTSKGPDVELRLVLELCCVPDLDVTSDIGRGSIVTRGRDPRDGCGLGVLCIGLCERSVLQVSPQVSAR